MTFIRISRFLKECYHRTVFGAEEETSYDLLHLMTARIYAWPFAKAEDGAANFRASDFIIFCRNCP